MYKIIQCSMSLRNPHSLPSLRPSLRLSKQYDIKKNNTINVCSNFVTARKLLLLQARLATTIVFDS